MQNEFEYTQFYTVFGNRAYPKDYVALYKGYNVLKLEQEDGQIVYAAYGPNQAIGHEIPEMYSKYMQLVIEHINFETSGNG